MAPNEHATWIEEVSLTELQVITSDLLAGDTYET